MFLNVDYFKCTDALVPHSQFFSLPFPEAEAEVEEEEGSDSGQEEDQDVLLNLYV